MAPGVVQTLLWEDFKEQSQRLVDRTRNAPHPWRWVALDRPGSILGGNLPGLQYLARCNVAVPVEGVPALSVPVLGEVEGGGDEHGLLEVVESLEDDGAAAFHGPSAGGGRYYVYDYHVVYSPTFGVPVLYFGVRHTDGTTVSVEEVMAAIPPSVLGVETDDPLKTWMHVTQAEHPVLGLPFFCLHGCETSELLSYVLQQSNGPNKVDYLTAFLSVLGSVGMLRPADVLG